MDKQSKSHQQQASKHHNDEQSSCGGGSSGGGCGAAGGGGGHGDPIAEIERKKLYYLERMIKEQEKANIRLLSIIENQNQEFRNHDRMIDLLYRIAFNK